MDSLPLIHLLKNQMAEADWRRVVIALQQDPLVWTRLKDAAFADQALEVCGLVPEAWSPGRLALLDLSAEFTPSDLHNQTLQSLDPALDGRAQHALRRLNSGNTDPLRQLSDAGLVALALREAYRRDSDWGSLVSHPATEPAPVIKTALACFLGYLPDPLELLSDLVRPGGGELKLQMALHALLSNPFHQDRQRELLQAVSERLDRRTVLFLLRKLAVLRPQMAASLARPHARMISQHPPANELESADRFLDLLERAELFRIAGLDRQTISSLQAAWEAGREIQSRIAAEIAISAAETDELIDDERSQLLGWEQAAQLATNSAPYLAKLALTLIHSGELERARAILPEDSTHPAIQLALAELALASDSPDQEAARELALRALQQAPDPSATLPRIMQRELRIQMIHLLLKLGLRGDALRAAEALLGTPSSDPVLWETMARAQLAAGRALQAVTSVELAIALRPADHSLRYLLADCLEQAGQWQEALDERTRILERIPAPASKDLRELARCALHAGELDLASEVCQQALQADQNDGLAHALLGEVLAMRGDAARALKAMQQATRLSPHLADPWLTLARAHQRAGQPRRAFETLRTGAHAVPDSPEIHFALGELYRADGALTQARAELRRASDLAPGYAQYAHVLGITLGDLGQMDEACEMLESAYQLEPGSSEIALAYARTLLETGRPQEALSVLSGIVQADMENREVLRSYARAVLEAGGQAEQAIAVLEPAVEQDPEDWEARAYLAEAYGRTGQFEEAFEGFRAALASELSSDPRWLVHLNLGLARAAMSMGQPETAIASLRSAVESKPDFLELHQLLSEACEAASLRKDSLAAARDALQLSPDDLKNLTWFADRAVKLGASVEAVSALERALELAPNSPDLLILLGQTQITIGEDQAAWEIFHRVQQAANVRAEDLLAAAEGFMALNDPFQALICLEQCLKLPSIDEIRVLKEAARAASASDRLEEALDYLDRSIVFEPENPDLRFRRAEILLELGRSQAAIASLEHALQLAPDEILFRSRAVALYRNAGNLPAALEQAEIAMNLDPGNLKIRYQAADLARSLLQPEYALRLLREGWSNLEVKFTGSNPDLNQAHSIRTEYLCLLAEIALDLGEERAFREALQTVIQFNAEDPRSKALLVRRVIRQDEHVEAQLAMDALRQTLNLVDSGDLDQTLAPRIDAATYLCVAEAAIELRDWQTAIQILDRLAQSQPNEPYIQLRTARGLALRAEQERLSEELDIRLHAPGAEALNEHAAERFEACIRLVSRTLGNETELPEFTRWSIRGRAAFAPEGLSPAALKELNRSPADIAARMAALRRTGEAAAAIAEVQAHSQHAEVLVEYALAAVPQHPARALTAARGAVERDPHNPVFQAVLSVVAERAGETEVALQALEKALDIWNNEPRWHARAAQLRLTQPPARLQPAEIAAAIHHLEQAVALEPDFGRHYLALGQARLMAGQIEEAVSALEEAVRLCNNEPAAWMALASAYWQYKDLEQAITTVQQAVELAPTSAEALRLKAAIELESGRPSKALQALEIALKQSPDDAQALSLKVTALAELDRPAEALKALASALSISRDPLPLLKQRIELIRKINGLDASLEALRELHAGYPEDAEVLSMLTRTLIELGRTQEAIRSARLALRYGEAHLGVQDLAYLHHLLGKLLRRDGQLDQAVHHLTLAIANDPQQVEPYLELGQTYLARRSPQQALEALEQALALAPEDARPYYQAGLVLKESKDYMRAESMFRKASELAPKDLNIRRQLGAVVALNIVHNNREASIEA